MTSMNVYAHCFSVLSSELYPKRCVLMTNSVDCNNTSLFQSCLGAPKNNFFRKCSDVFKPHRGGVMLRCHSTETYPDDALNHQCNILFYSFSGPRGACSDLPLNLL